MLCVIPFSNRYGESVPVPLPFGFSFVPGKGTKNVSTEKDDPKLSPACFVEFG